MRKAVPAAVHIRNLTRNFGIEDVLNSDLHNTQCARMHACTVGRAVPRAGQFCCADERLFLVFAEGDCLQASRGLMN